MNTVRLRIWVNPEGGTNGLEYNLNLAKRFQSQGYKIYLDFHFSDSWADPNKQPPPAAWPMELKPLARKSCWSSYCLFLVTLHVKFSV